MPQNSMVLCNLYTEDRMMYITDVELPPPLLQCNAKPIKGSLLCCSVMCLLLSLQCLVCIVQYLLCSVKWVVFSLGEIT